MRKVKLFIIVLLMFIGINVVNAKVEFSNYTINISVDKNDDLHVEERFKLSRNDDLEMVFYKLIPVGESAIDASFEINKENGNCSSYCLISFKLSEDEIYTIEYDISRDDFDTDDKYTFSYDSIFVQNNDEDNLISYKDVEINIWGTDDIKPNIVNSNGIRFQAQNNSYHSNSFEAKDSINEFEIIFNDIGYSVKNNEEAEEEYDDVEYYDEEEYWDFSSEILYELKEIFFASYPSLIGLVVVIMVLIIYFKLLHEKNRNRGLILFLHYLSLIVIIALTIFNYWLCVYNQSVNAFDVFICLGFTFVDVVLYFLIGSRKEQKFIDLYHILLNILILVVLFLSILSYDIGIIIPIFMIFVISLDLLLRVFRDCEILRHENVAINDNNIS